MPCGWSRNAAPIPPGSCSTRKRCWVTRVWMMVQRPPPASQGPGWCGKSCRLGPSHENLEEGATSPTRGYGQGGHGVVPFPSWRHGVEQRWGCLELRVCCCSVTKSRPILCNSMDCSMPDFPVLHYLLESTQGHAHWVIDAIHHLILSGEVLNQHWLSFISAQARIRDQMYSPGFLNQSGTENSLSL